MLRQNNPVLHHVDRSFWEYAERMDDGGMGCKFCGHRFAKGTSITRIKFHLARVKCNGVRICGKVPQDVQDAALAARTIGGPPEKKLKTGAGSSNNEVTNAISASAQQQRNQMMMAHQQEDLSLEDWMASITIEDSFHERLSFNQADEPRGDPSQPTNDQLFSSSVNNDVSVNDAQNVVGVRTERDNLSVDAGRTQVGVQGIEQGGEEGRVCSHLDMANTGEGSAQHVDRIVPPTIDENYNRREATERLVQPDVGASSFGVYGNLNAISTSQNNVAGDAGTAPAAETMGHAPGRSLEEHIRSLEACLMGDGTNNGTGGGVQPGAGASSFGGLIGNTNDTPGDPLPTSSTKLVGRAFEQNTNEIWSWLMDNEVSTIGIYGMGGVGKTTMLKHIHNAISTSAQQQNNEMMMAHQREDLSLDEDWMASITAEDMEPLVRGTKAFPLLFKPPLTSSSLMDTLGGVLVGASAAGVSTLPFDNGGNTNVFALSASLLKINKGDITKWSVDGSSDAIVNPADVGMLGGGGGGTADGAIHRAAGPQLRDACYTVPEVRPGVRCPTGEARITPGFNLPASHVIHTVGPIFDVDGNPEASLRNAYRNCLTVAKDNNIKYIAFPAISCGVYGYPYKEATTVAISAVKEFADDLKEVHFVLLMDEMYKVWLEKAKELLQA